MSDLEKSIRVTLRNSLGLQPKENFVIVAEASLFDYGELLWNGAKRLSCNPFLIKFWGANPANQDLPDCVYTCTANSDAFMILSTKAISEKKLYQAQQNGARFLIIQNATRGLIERTLKTNYKRISNISRKISELFSIGRNLTLKSASGTNAHISISKTKGMAETGVACESGAFSFLPAGEACVHLNTNIDGRIAIDRIAGQKRKLHKPIFLNIHNGRVTQIKGGQEAEELRRKIRRFGQGGRKIYEFGVGTNSHVIFGNTAQEDEKASGSIHISLGQNRITKIQGKISEAIKGIILKPSLEIDGRLIIEKGKILV